MRINLTTQQMTYVLNTQLKKILNLIRNIKNLLIKSINEIKFKN